MFTLRPCRHYCPTTCCAIPLRSTRCISTSATFFQATKKAAPSVKRLRNAIAAQQAKYEGRERIDIAIPSAGATFADKQFHGLTSGLDERAEISRFRKVEPELVQNVEKAVRHVTIGPDSFKLLVFVLRVMHHWQSHVAEYAPWTKGIQADYEQWKYECGVTTEQIYNVMRQQRLFQTQGLGQQAYLCRMCCSREGYRYATYDLVMNFIRTNGEGIKAWRSDRVNMNKRYPLTKHWLISTVIEDLHKLVDVNDVCAISLLAQLKTVLEGEKAAIPLWKQVMDLVETKTEKEMMPSRYENLTRPWIEIARVYARNAENADLVRRALNHGMSQDDPDAYYLYAVQDSKGLHRSVTDKSETLSVEQEEITDQELALVKLNALTKSAASGSVESAILLARHYANDKWVDSYDLAGLDPSETPPIQKLLEGVYNGCLSIINPGLFKEIQVKKQKEQNRIKSIRQARQSANIDMLTPAVRKQVANYATSCKTPEERIQMAIQWLNVAYKYRSMEAVLLLAKLHSHKYIFTSHNLQIPTRAPDEQKDNNFTIILPQTDDPNNHTQEVVISNGIPNPYYSPKLIDYYLSKVAQFGKAMLEVKSLGISRDGDRRTISKEWYTFPEIANRNEQNFEVDWKTATLLADTLGVDISLNRYELAYKHAELRERGILEPN